MTTGYQIRLNDTIPSLARISHKSGIIEVQPKFYDLEPMEQEFVLEHLLKRIGCYNTALNTTPPDMFSISNPDDLNNKFCADRSAIEIMKQRHPDVPLSYWPKMLENIFKKVPDFLTSDDLKRPYNL